MALDPGPALVADIVAWTVLGLGTGYHHHRLPLERLADDTWLTTLRSWERGGAIYQDRFRIKAWKDRLPEAGAFFRGGLSKRALPGRSRPALERFAAETRRAERVHWSLLLAGPAFLLWNPPDLGAVMVAYAVVANAPFIAIQRYNRGRIQAILRRKVLAR